MAHRLNTNKQFMVGNGLLAFAVIFVVVIFVYMSMRLQRQQAQDAGRAFPETYTITLQRGFAGDSISLSINNDSLLLNRCIVEEPVSITLNRFAKENQLFIINNVTEEFDLFELSERGGEYTFEKQDGRVVLLGK
ncbi:MAG: hypothetical protein IJ511_05355 [Bacteroides sp.]|nr:hypothetical protein [Bacteroides sp.]